MNIFGPLADVPDVECPKYWKKIPCIAYVSTTNPSFNAVWLNSCFFFLESHWPTVSARVRPQFTA